MYDLDEIRRRVSLVALAEEAGASFKDASHLSSPCPLPRHTGDRSSRAFTIFDHEQKWKCHSACPPDASGGDVVKFYMAWQGVDYKTALAELAERAGWAEKQPARYRTVLRPLPAKPSPLLVDLVNTWQRRGNQFIAYCQNNLAGPSNARAREYLEQERGLWPETWQTFRVGYNPRNVYDTPETWGLAGKRIWLPRGIVIPGLRNDQPSYIKIRRALPGQVLGQYIGLWTEQDGLPEIKFGGPRGGTTVLFGQQHFTGLPVLLLVEGEWDAMLTWQWCQDFCDVSTLGGAQSHFDTYDLAVLVCYQAILVVHDADTAGDKGRQYIARLHTQNNRIRPIQAPELNGALAHDLTDFWKAGGNLRAWAACHVAEALEESLEQAVVNPTIERWRKLAAWTRQETGFRLLDSSAEQKITKYQETPL